jgi:hypothetical protein
MNRNPGISKGTGTWLLLIGACLGTIGVPALFHGEKILLGRPAGLVETVALLATTFALLALGFYAVAGQGKRNGVKIALLSLAGTFVFFVSGVILAVTIGILLAHFGVAGYHLYTQ